MRYLDLKLSYYYFRFLKTGVRHTGILLPISIFNLFIIIGMTFCISLANFMRISKRTVQ